MQMNDNLLFIWNKTTSLDMNSQAIDPWQSVALSTMNIKDLP